MSIDLQSFKNAAFGVIDGMYKTESTPIRNAARLIHKTIKQDGVVHVFGTGHSLGFGMEIANRAGGLVPFNVIAIHETYIFSDLDKKYYNTEIVERAPSLAHDILEMNHISRNDAFILVSNSGINGTIVEMALEVKKRGLPLIVITSLEHTNSCDSRHPGGKKLVDIGDIVIDNRAPKGDAFFTTQETEHLGNICGISSITGCFIAQSMVIEVINAFLNEGVSPPILLSANIPGADEHNRLLKEKYTKAFSRKEVKTCPI